MEAVVRGRGGRRRWTRGGPETRQRILAVALRLFAERGFHQTTVRDIAGECGISDAAIYYHFDSKRALLEALYEERGFIQALESLERLSSRAPLRQRLLLAAQDTADLLERNADLLRVTYMELLTGDRGATALHHALLERWRLAVEKLLRGYAERGELAVADPAVAAETFVHVMTGAFIGRLAAGRDEAGSAASPEGDLRACLARAAEHLAEAWQRSPA